MGKDLIQKRCLSDNERYADLINGLLFGGRQKLGSDDLSEPELGTYGKKERDIIKRASFGVNFAVIGVENQEMVHYLMPLRNMIYDAEEYQRQARMIGKRVRGEKGLTVFKG